MSYRDSLAKNSSAHLKNIVIYQDFCEELVHMIMLSFDLHMASFVFVDYAKAIDALIGIGKLSSAYHKKQLIEVCMKLNVYKTFYLIFKY